MNGTFLKIFMYKFLLHLPFPADSFKNIIINNNLRIKKLLFNRKILHYYI